MFWNLEIKILAINRKEAFNFTIVLTYPHYIIYIYHFHTLDQRIYQCIFHI